MSKKLLLEKIAGDPELLERLLLVAESPAPYDVIDSSQKAYRVLLPRLAGFSEERLAVLGLDRKLRVLGVKTLTLGNDSFTVVCPRQIFRWALQQGRSGASHIILAHNHPSGDHNPSSQDLEVTRRVAHAGHVLGIRLLDHIVIGGTNYTSIANKHEVLPSWADQPVHTD